jgi:hypothetical protein
MRRFALGFQTADCLALLNVRTEAAGAQAEGFATDPTVFDALGRAFRQQFDVDIAVSRRTVSPQQCAALRRLSDLPARQGPGLTLRAPSQTADGLPAARRGEPMLATIAGVAGRSLDLIEVGSDGMARALFPPERPKDGSLFRPIRISPDSQPGPLILIAISGKEGLPPQAVPGPADALFRGISERASAGGDVPGIALRIVTVQP